MTTNYIYTTVLLCLIMAFAARAQDSPTDRTGQATQGEKKDPFAGWEPPKAAASEFSVGDRWVWSVKDDTALNMQAKGCSPGYPSGAQEIETVESINNVGYVTRIVGPMPDWRYSRTYLNDGSYRAISEGKPILAGPIRLPLRPGNAWETTLAGGQVVTTLKCEAKNSERMPVGNEELEVVPIVCRGKWRHVQSGNSDSAEYKYWYSPVVGRSVRHTALTYAWGSICLNVEWRLDSYTRNK